jgi:hypothetical protein
MKERQVSMKKGLLLLLLFALLASSFAVCKAEPVQAASTYTVSGTKHYLALRSAARYSASNEIGKLYNGDTVTVSKANNSSYWYVYSSKLNKSGYVNKKYLVAGSKANTSSASSGSSYTVSGTKHYLALRSAASYSAKNEIGKLYNGETVTVQNASGSYWYVYSSKLNKSGYVNKKYLTAGSSSSASNNGTSYTVSGTKNYLAIRSAAKYSASNELGRLYNGETVTVQNASGTYWYVYSPKLNISGYVNSKYLK